MLTSTTKQFIMLSSLILNCSKFRISTCFSMSPTTTTTTTKRTLTTVKASTNFISIPDAISQFSTTTFIDGSWHLNKARSSRSEYEQGPRIQGSHFFDIDDVATTNHPKNLPHMMPSKDKFSSAMDAFRIKDKEGGNIVIYGTEDCAFVSRAYYTFKRMCHPNSHVYLMQGSLKEWMGAGGPIETDEKTSFYISHDNHGTATGDAKYEALEDTHSVTMDQMLEEVSSDNTAPNSSIIIDARGSGRFNAEVPEPRPGLRGGHMPGAYNLPFTTLLQEDDVTKFKSKEDMKAVFENAGLVDIEKKKEGGKVILSCGSGVTACVLAVALLELGKDSEDIFIYDGSWLEWGSDPDTPIV